MKRRYYDNASDMGMGKGHPSRNHGGRRSYNSANSVPGSESATNCGIPSGAKRQTVDKHFGYGMKGELPDLFEAVEKQQAHDSAGMKRYTKPMH